MENEKVAGTKGVQESKNDQPLNKRRGIVFLYGFEWCNPNGDPSFDNEPRIYEGKVFVTDVFLKRRIRDYVAYVASSNKNEEWQKKNQIFVREITNEKGEKLTPEERVRQLLNEKEVTPKEMELLKKGCWDIRVFGCMIPLPGKETSFKSIGPVQATFGISLNSVESLAVSITNVMPSKEEKARGGAIGKKYVVPIAVVEHYLFVNQVTAKETGMTEEDYNLLLEALKNLKLTPTLSTSSKNVTPLLIVEIEFKDSKYANLFGFLEAKEKKTIPTSIKDFEINLSKLCEKIESLQGSIIENYKVYVKKEYKENFNIPQGVTVEEF
jgi:CRISPR-associated protein Csh2